MTMSFVYLKKLKIIYLRRPFLQQPFIVVSGKKNSKNEELLIYMFMFKNFLSFSYLGEAKVVSANALTMMHSNLFCVL